MSPLGGGTGFNMNLESGKIYDGKVTGITKYGAFVEIAPGATGMVHISEVSSSYVNDIKDCLSLGQEVKVKVLPAGKDGKIALSIKRALEREQKRGAKPPASPDSAFEDMLNKFKQNSDEKMYDLKRIIDNKRKSSSRRK